MKIKSLFLGLFSLLSVEALAVNNSIDVTGTDEILNCQSPFGPTTTDFTVEAWYNVTGGAYSDRLFGITGNKLEIGVGNGGVRFYDGTTWNDTGLSALSGWNHLALTNSSDSVRIYVNGLKVFTMPTYSFGFTGLENFSIGAKDDGTGNIVGKIDEVRVWNVARSDSEILLSMNQLLVGDEAGLVRYYPFNDGTHNNISSVPGGDFTLVAGTVNYVNEGFDNYLDNFALNFDGLNDEAILTTYPLSGNSDFTIEAQFKSSGTNDYSRIFHWSPFQLEVAIIGGQIALYNSNWVNTIPHSSVTDNQWHHIAAVHSLGTTTIYIDGLDIYQTTSFSYSFDVAELSIGNNGSNAPFNGVIDEVRVWDAAKSVAELIANFNEELNGDEANLVVYFDFNAPSDNIMINGTNNPSQFERVGHGGNLPPNFSPENQKLINQAFANLSEYSNESKITVYPNPTIGLVSIEGVEEGFMIQLMSLTGNLITEMSNGYSENTLEIDLSSLSQGVYLIQVLNNSKEIIASKKLVKK